MFDLWQNVLAEIRHHISDAAFQTWFHGTKLLSEGEKEVLIGVPSTFFIANLEKKYSVEIKSIMEKLGVSEKAVRYVVDNSSREKKPRQINRSQPVNLGDIIKPVNVARRSPGDDNGLNPRYSFERFIAGSCNDLALSVAQAIVSKPGETRYNPFFLYGGPGVGKTHLAQAIGNEVIKKSPATKVLYITIEDFYQSFVRAMKNRESFTNKYRKVDVLIVDDIQFIVGKDKTQEEFFHTFNELYTKNKQIIITSDKRPDQLAQLDQRLVTRLGQGLQVDIQMPDFETRCAILKARAEWDGLDIDSVSVEYIANNVRTNIRDLEQKYNKLNLLCELQKLTPADVVGGGYLDDSGRGGRIKDLTPKKILDKTAFQLQTTADELIHNKSRTIEAKIPRQIAMYLMRHELDMSFPKIKYEFGMKDHTTIMNSVKCIEKKLDVDNRLREQVAAIRDALYV